MKWLHRDLMNGPYLCLCTTEAEFHRAIATCKVSREEVGRWVPKGADACTHSLKNPEGKRVCIVAFNPGPDRSGIQIAGLLVHEAVHVFQEHCTSIGEGAPSAEFEAYSIQSISQRLMWAYEDGMAARH